MRQARKEKQAAMRTNKENRAEWRQSGSSWLIVRQENGGKSVLTLDSAGKVGGEEMLPVFSFEEEASLFVRLKGLRRDGWRVAKSANGEILSLLFGLCRGVKRVAFDPLPGIGASGNKTRLFTVGRRVFMERLANRGRHWFYREVYGD